MNRAIIDNKIRKEKSRYGHYFSHKEMIHERNHSILKTCCVVYMFVLLFYTLFEIANLSPTFIINHRIDGSAEFLVLLYLLFDIINAAFIVVLFWRNPGGRPGEKVNPAYCVTFEVTLLTFFLIEGSCIYSDRVSMYIPLALVLIVALFSHTFSYSLFMIIGYTTSFIVLVVMFKQLQIAWLDIQIAIATLFSSLICYAIATSLRVRENEAIEQSIAASNSKSQFLSRMSHDLRTPMNGILGLAELSQDEYDVDILRSNMAQIQSSGEYLLSLINDTLDYQRIESGKLKLESQVVDLQALLDSVLDIVRPSVEKKNIELRVENHCADLSGNVRIDPVRFKQIVINLVSNAIKFTPEGGAIELTFAHIKQEGIFSHVQITITDTGIGMSEDFIGNRIFQPFSQESNPLAANYAGSGLGLSIVKSLIDLMGGTISVESELGAGTKFTIYMTIERVALQDAKSPENKDIVTAEDAASTLKGKSILMAEDHPLNAQIAIRLLEKAGCTVAWAKDGKECCQIFADSPAGQFDAILMDIRMPAMDGLEATRTIRSMTRADAKTIPIVAMTANAYEDDKKESLAAGIDAHLAKPVNSSLLYETLCKKISESKECL